VIAAILLFREDPEGTVPSDRAGHRALFVMNADGGNLRRLTDKLYCRQPTWSADSKRIAFIARNQPVNFVTGDIFGDIHLANRDGSGPAKLTNKLGEQPQLDADPAWCPDGKKIAFVRFAKAGYEIHVIDPDSGRERRLLADSSKFGMVFPVWFPDGSRLVYAWSSEGGLEIFVCDADGRNTRQVTRLKGENTWPNWSPDGKHIYFFHRAGAERRKCYRIQVDGTNLQEVSFRALLWVGSFAWTPAR
jgi:TolB protein